MKQGIGSTFGHFSNIYLSVVIASSLVSGDECQWYCLTYVVDCTLGTAINLGFLYLFERLQQHLRQNSSATGGNIQQCINILEMGDYGDPPQLSLWIPQLLLWLTIVIVGKILTLFLLMAFITQLDAALTFLFQGLKNHPKVELLMVMVIIPTILNSAQFWITDTFLKKQDHASNAGVDGNVITAPATNVTILHHITHERLSTSDLDEHLIRQVNQIII